MIIANIGATNAQIAPSSVSTQQLYVYVLQWLDIMNYMYSVLLTIHHVHTGREPLQQSRNSHNGNWNMPNKMYVYKLLMKCM